MAKDLIFGYTSSIIYQDQDILALNKPAGIVVHKANLNDKRPSLVDFIVIRYPQIRNIGSDPLRPGIVHRLDKDTSGLILVARNDKALKFLKEQFLKRTIKKEYLVLVKGQVMPRQGIINKPIAWLKNKPFKLGLASNHKKSRQAITKYKVKKYFKDYSFLLVKPLTGRTHQIRVHLASIGHPVVGDARYGFKKEMKKHLLKRPFLHAFALEFETPSGKFLRLEADLPQDLKDFVKTLPRE